MDLLQATSYYTCILISNPLQDSILLLQSVIRSYAERETLLYSHPPLGDSIAHWSSIFFTYPYKNPGTAA